MILLIPFNRRKNPNKYLKPISITPANNTVNSPTVMEIIPDIKAILSSILNCFFILKYSKRRYPPNNVMMAPII